MNILCIKYMYINRVYNWNILWIDRIVLKEENEILNFPFQCVELQTIYTGEKFIQSDSAFTSTQRGECVCNTNSIFCERGAEG